MNPSGLAGVVFRWTRIPLWVVEASPGLADCRAIPCRAGVEKCTIKRLDPDFRARNDAIRATPCDKRPGDLDAGHLAPVFDAGV